MYLHNRSSHITCVTQGLNKLPSMANMLKEIKFKEETMAKRYLKDSNPVSHESVINYRANSGPYLGYSSIVWEAVSIPGRITVDSLRSAGM